jgi:hypothetical protein
MITYPLRYRQTSRLVTYVLRRLVYDYSMCVIIILLNCNDTVVRRRDHTQTWLCIQEQVRIHCTAPPTGGLDASIFVYKCNQHH